MSDTYVPSFFSDDPRTGALTYPQLEARRRIAMALATRNRPYPKTIGEGLTALGEGIGEGYVNRNLERAEVAQRDKDAAGQRIIEGNPAPAAPAAPGRVSDVAPSDAVASYTGGVSETGEPVKMAMATDQSLATEQAPQKPPGMSIDEWMIREKRNESGGAKDPYRLIGPRSVRGDYPYGAHQVMGENIPKWTKQYVGREMTPQEFLLDDKAQDAVARGKGGEYLAKYGPEGAAAAWFAGERGMNDPNRKDTLGTHVAEYKRRFSLPLVSRDQIAASAARNPNAFAAAPQMSPEAASAMAYAPEGGGDAADMLSALTNPQPPGLGLRGPSDNAFPTPPVRLASRDVPTTWEQTATGYRQTATDAPRDSIAAAVAAQSGVVPPQQVAAGPAPIPQAPLPVPPTITPQTVPKAPAVPAQPVNPGSEPKLDSFINEPRMKQRLDELNRVAADNTYGPLVQERAKKKIDELHLIARDEHTKQWTVWHEAKKVQDEFNLNKEDRDLKTTKARGEVEDAAAKRELTYRFGGKNPDDVFKGFDADKTIAEVGQKVRQDNSIILKALNDGVILGWGSGFRLNTAKLASWAFQNGYSSEQAANTEIIRALGGSRIREALTQINPTGSTSNVDTMIARQLSGADPAMEPKSFAALLHKSSLGNARTIDDYEKKIDETLSGTNAHRLYRLPSVPTSPMAETDKMLANRDDKALRAEYDNVYGDGSSALEIERFKRRQRRGGG